MFRPTLARLYASSKRTPPVFTIAGPSSTSASLSQARSRPLSVRLRRAQRYAQDIGLAPSTDKKPARRLKLDEFLRRDEEKPKNIPIPRIRGMTVAYHKGKPYTVKVTGQKVYLPNLIFRLVRNYTPPGQPYNPWLATFRIPKNLTKTDVRSYLMAVYGVQTTYIRTDNYRAELARAGKTNPDRTPRIASYKRAVVGLVEPFYYPLRLEDMPPERRKWREGVIEEKLQVKMYQDLNTLNVQNQLLMQHMPKHQAPSTYWLRDVRPSRAKIIKQVTEKRLRRESLIGQQVAKWRKQRVEGERISVSTPAQFDEVEETSNV
ncbi:mitochondrial ribosomal protein L23 [Mycena maculata]|uniref:Large ribosomal subunit protein uL23m n=1 Tax=Mycena maculata TaxID=230809 RepID=A0AAD7HHX3_9AGAR|nr:mitochondrial ribosomal protein L23 [Mycena maculata]